MNARARRLILLLAVCGVGLAGAWWMARPGDAADPEKPVLKSKPLLKSKVVGWDEARSTKADWGEMRFYFQGETLGTKNVLTAVATVEPGKTVHPAHRHAEEEYLVIAAGSGTWSLAGKESAAKRGDVLYVEPWVYHGVTNTGKEPLVFLVIRYNSKGVKIPPRPDNRPDEL